MTDTHDDKKTADVAALPCNAFSTTDWKYRVQFETDTAITLPITRYFDGSIREQYTYGDTIAHWEPPIQAFWRRFPDRYYQFFVMAPRLKPGRILEVGAEFYNKYIKEVIAPGQELTVVDIKAPDHPDIASICGLDYYYRLDMTSDDGLNYPWLQGHFDTVLSFGVLSAYDFTYEECVRYVQNMARFLKPEGLAIFKIDRHRLTLHTKLPSFAHLISIIQTFFAIRERDILTVPDEEFVCLYAIKQPH
ncbi:MAG TPA: hypothetical protein DCS43_08615 [Verrucomicrobia bacterium]|nr:hypothetical protein [Verrucomicrobiota bacterium]